MRTRKVDFKTYWSHEAREARRGLVQRRGRPRSDYGGEHDTTTEAEIAQQRQEAQAARDERAERRALTKWKPVAEQLEEARNGDVTAAKRVVRHAGFSTRAQAEAFCAAAGIEDEPQPEEPPVSITDTDWGWPRRSPGELR